MFNWSSKLNKIFVIVSTNFWNKLLGRLIMYDCIVDTQSFAQIFIYLKIS